jgi:glucose/mannose-6-phosphate isomerase
MQFYPKLLYIIVIDKIIVLITEADIAKVDQERLHLIYDKWPVYFKDAEKIPCKLDHEPDFYESIILCGIGGSATSCDILNDLLHSFSNVNSTVLKGQDMPFFVDKRSLVIVNSISGNTLEAISMVEKASERNAEVICISSGGKLKEVAAKNSHRHIHIPNLSLPRASLPYLIMPGLNLIKPFLKKSLEEEISSIHRSISNIAKDISARVPEESNIAKKIASFLENGFVFCFTSPYLMSVGTRFKNSLNENAKVHCVKESVLEASHNEIVPFTFYNNSFAAKVLLLEWVSDQTIVKERFKKVQCFLTRIKQPLMELSIFENTLLNAIICSIYILDYATIYMAISRKLDPSPTPAIDILKEV